jgi:hypothetical protein
MQKLCSLGVHVEYPVELPTGDKVWSGIGDIISKDVLPPLQKKTPKLIKDIRLRVLRCYGQVSWKLRCFQRAKFGRPC